MRSAVSQDAPPSLDEALGGSALVGADVGAVRLAGSTTLAGGAYTVVGGGADIWGRADAFHFASTPLAGDGAVVARLASLDGADPWAKAGLMVRASLDADAPHVFAALTPGNGLILQRRTAAGALAERVAAVAASAPVWVRLVREGDLFTASRSADGVAWVELGRVTVPLGTNALAGLAVTAHDNRTTATARFDGVTVGSSPSPPPTEWEARATAPLALREAPTAVVNGRYYVFSGFFEGSLISAATTSYDPATDTWRANHAPMPFAVTHTPAVAAGTDVWIVGGFAGNSPGVATDRVQVYNTATNRWRDGPRLPAPMASHAAALLGRKIYAFGGLRPDRQTDIGHHFVLDLDNLAAGWRPAAPLPNPRNHLSAAAVGGRVYAIGGQYGHDVSRTMTAFLHAYDPQTNTWTRRADLRTPKSHFEPSTDVFDGRIIIVGGDLGRPQQTKQIDLYNTLTNTWTRQPDLPVALNSPGARVFGDLLFVSHGGNGNGHFDTTRGRRQERYPSDVLAFSPGELRLSDAAGGNTGEGLLWTLSGETSFTVQPSPGAGWLELLTPTGQAGPTAAEVEVRADATGLAPGSYTATLTATAPGHSPATLQVTLDVRGGADDVVARINAGGSAVTAQRIDWSADADFEGGRTYANTTGADIAGTDADAVYRDGRTSTERRGRFAYHIPVPAEGWYTVRLHFAEVYWGVADGRPGGAGSRVFDVAAEGGLILDDYDISRDVGPATAVVKEFEMKVNDGTLDLEFSASVDQPAVAAIEVLRSQSAPIAAARHSALPTEFALGSPVPNPSVSEATLPLDLPEDAAVGVALYDVLGRRVQASTTTLDAGAGQPLRLDLRGVAPGVYVYHVRAEMARGTAVGAGKLTVTR